MASLSKQMTAMNNMFTSENITELKKNEVFVFGSNLAGRHAAGAAKVAHDHFGAVYGVGEGLIGQSYALPTLDKKLQQRNDEQLTMSVRKLWKCAKENPDKVFLLTKVGCGIAGYDEEYMADKFKDAPGNIIKPKGW